MSVLVVVNGKARAGKDTAVDFIRYCLKEDHGIPTEQRSSIEIVMELLKATGIELQEKDDDLRKLIAMVGNQLEDYHDTRTNDIIQRFKEFSYANNGVYFTHTREILLIEKFKTKVVNQTSGIIQTLFVDNRNVPLITTNDIDKNVEQEYSYDYVIDNSYDRGKLFSVCENYARYLANMIKPDSRNKITNPSFYETSPFQGAWIK